MTPFYVNLLTMNIILRFFYEDLLLKISWSSGWLKRYSSTTSFIGPESRLLTPETDRLQAKVMFHNLYTNWGTSTNWGTVLLSFIAGTKVFCRHQEASQEAFKSYRLCCVIFLFILERLTMHLIFKSKDMFFYERLLGKNSSSIKPSYQQ